MISFLYLVVGNQIKPAMISQMKFILQDNIENLINDSSFRKDTLEKLIINKLQNLKFSINTF